MKIDQETAQQLREGDLIREMTRSEGWPVARKLLYDLMRVNDSVSTLVSSGRSLEDIGKEAMIRAHAIGLVESWINAIEGRVEQHGQQSALLAEVATEEVFRTYS